MKQTAVEFLVRYLIEYGFDLSLHNIEIEQAHKMENQKQDEFATIFSDWVSVNAYKYPTKTSTKELLEIYKKEKSL